LGDGERVSASILIVDDDETIRYFLKRDLEAEGFQVATAEDGTSGLKALEREPANLVLLDIRLPDLSGIQVLERIRAQWPDQIVVMLTGEPDHETAVQAMRLGACDYLTKGKPIRDELLLVLTRELSAQRLGREVQHHRREKSQRFSREFVRGESASMKEVYSIVEQVAQSESTSVLIEGESGSGKELIAHMIHELSARRGKPMLELNCAAIPRELLESELFGHEKGAFTDAHQQKQGLLELANGGTLFLDEVGEMSLTLQVKLLRVLERMTFKRVGGTKDISVSVRVISATNQDLSAMVREQRFREDLYYRLKVVPIHVPPLRERREDILPLARHFLEQFNRQFQKEFRDLHPEAERPPRHGTPADTPLTALHDVLSSQRLPEAGLDLEGALGTVEREIIQLAFDQTRGNQSRAATLLGMKRDKLRYRMKLYGFQDAASEVG
jgi:two-component system response regulator AtoC